MKEYFVYILKCNDKSYYTGITNNLSLRLVQHQSGFDKESYTFSRGPVTLVFYISFNDVDQAIKFEKQLKGLSRKKKEAVIHGNWEELKNFAECKNATSHKFYNKNN